MYKRQGLDRDVSELSGGQRTKILLAKLLLEKPDILLLDEPTNYLDEQHIRWLKTYLQNYENAFILISHDMPFTNEVVNLIYHVENCRLTRYVGNVDEFHRPVSYTHLIGSGMGRNPQTAGPAGETEGSVGAPESSAGNVEWRSRAAEAAIKEGRTGC